MKRALPYALLFASVVALAALAHHLVGSGLAESARVLERTGKLRLLGVEVSREVLVQEAATQTMLLDPDQLADVSDTKIAAFDRQLAKTKELEQLAPDQRVRNVVRELERIDSEQLKPIDEQLLEKMAGGELDEGRALYKEKYLPARAQYASEIAQLSEAADSLAREAEGELNEQTTRTIRLLLGVFAALGVVMLVLVLVNQRRRAAIDASDRLQRLVGITHRLLATNALPELEQQLEKEFSVPVKLRFATAPTSFGTERSLIALRGDRSHLDVPLRIDSQEDRGFWESLALTVSQHVESLEARRVIEEGAARLKASEAQTRAVLQSLSEGLVVIDREQRIEPLWSRSFEAIAPARAGGKFGEWLYPGDEKRRVFFDLLYQQVIDDIFPFEVSAGQFPAVVEREGKSWALSLSPIRSADGSQLDHVIFTVRDVTEETRLRRASLESRDLFQFLERVREQPDEARAFMRETRRELTELQVDLVTLKRRLHTIKGTTAVFGLQAFAELVHHVEDDVEEAGTLRSECESRLLHTWAQFESRVATMLGEERGEQVTMPREAIDSLSAMLVRHGELDGAAWVRGLAMTQLRGRLEGLRRQAQETARKLGKQVEVTIACDELTVDAERYGPFLRSLVHVVRNAVDHGIESAERRAETQKPAAGRLRIEATPASDGVTIAIADDGAGVDFEAVARKAKAKGLPHTTHKDLVAAMFADGVSTRDAVTDLSGRGVGLAAVWSECGRLDGTIEVEVDHGTRFVFHLPSSPSLRLVRPLATAAGA
ncbi:MAG: ATP-binding protein [Archangium sp.]